MLHREQGQLIVRGRLQDHMFILDSDEVKSAMYAKGLKIETNIELWHKRIGHINLQRLRAMQTKGVVIGLPVFDMKQVNRVCEACQLGKQHRHPFPKERNVSKGLLDVIHSDVWGPAQTPTLGGCRFYVTFIDDYSRYTWIFPMKKKSEVFTHFQKFKNQAEKETNRKVRCLRSDGGKEYFSEEFTSYLEDEGIRREFTCRNTPQQNGVAERKNRVILEVARAMINEKHMPRHYWAEAACTAVYLMNRCTTDGVHELTPYEKYVGRKPDLAHVRVFGSIAYVHIPDKQRQKLDPKSEKCILMGYSLEQKGYKCFNPSTRMVRVSRDVVFDESASWYAPASSTPEAPEHDSDIGAESRPRAIGHTYDSPSSSMLSGPSEPESIWSVSQADSDLASGSRLQATRLDKGKAKMKEYDSDNSSTNESDLGMSPRSLDSEFGVPIMRTPGVKKALASTNEKLRRSSRQKNTITRFGYNEYMAHHYAFMMKVASEQEPESFPEAARNPRWMEAMEEEMQALVDNGTWDLVPPPTHKKAIGCRWIYKIKHNADGTVNRYKARLVAKGYAQTHGIDYEETFAPVAKMTTIRTTLALAAAKGWHLHQMDVKNAFLQGELEEEVYMVQPPGFKSTSHPRAVCRLKKPLYGLKQAPRAWHSKITQFLHRIGFQMSKSDNSLYVRNDSSGQIFIIIYVDDLVIG